MNSNEESYEPLENYDVANKSQQTRNSVGIAHDKALDKIIIFNLFVFILGIILLSGLGSAVQEPSGWWNQTANFGCTTSCNISNEYNTTTANLTYNAGRFLINNSQLNFTIGQMTSSTASGILNIQDSLIRGSYGALATNRIYLRRNLNFTLSNNSFLSFGSYEIEGTGATSNYIGIINNALFRDSGRMQVNAWHYFNITNSRFYNITTANNGAIRLRTRPDANYNLINNSFENVSGQGIEVFLGVNNVQIINNTIKNTGNHGIDITDSNNTYVYGNYLQNINGYGIDFHSQGSNHFAESNIIINATNGVIYSMGDGGFGKSFNLTSKNNKVYNITADGFGYSFNNVINGTSLNDYTYSGGVRCFSIVTNVSNIYLYNFTSQNCLNYSVMISNNAFNVYLNQTRLINNSVAYYINNASNVYLNNSILVDSYDNLQIGDTGNVTNLVLTDYDKWNITFPQTRRLYLNLSNQYLWFSSWGVFTNQINLNSQTNSLIYFSNGSVACSDISTCDGNINITLTPNNYSYILDNFNVTEGVTRQFSPLSVSGSSTSKTITSQLSQAINATVVVNAPSCPISGTYDGTSISSSSCNGNQATFLLEDIPAGVSVLSLSQVTTITDSLIDQLALTPALIGLILLALFFGIAIKALLDFRNMGKIDWKQLLIQVIIVGFIGIVLLLFSVVYQTLGNIGG